jgi:flagellar biosynthesis/type III secretory pathway chaperone
MWEDIKMNDILHDIEKLTDIKESVGLFSTSTIQSLIQDLIDEKQSIVQQFEKEIPSHIEELNKKLKGEI